MPFRTRALAALALTAGLLGALGLAGGPRPAAAAVAIEGTFTARAECPAYQSFNAGTNPGLVTLTPGTVYGAFELNRPQGAWVRLRIPGATPQERWVARECGRLEVYGMSETVQPDVVGPDPQTPLEPDIGTVGPVGTDTPVAPLLPPDTTRTLAPLGDGTLISRSPRTFPWFFDRIDQGPEDPTPPPPVLGEIDVAVLEMCGGWGDPVPEEAFTAFLDAHPALRGSVLATLRGDQVTLVDAWFDEDGFRHIFCGEPDTRDDGRWRLGGLHYMGRYAQAQLNGWAGRLEGGCSVVEIDPPIYTEGVVFRAPDGTTGVKCINGYALGLTASDILHEVTKAYRLARGTLGPGTNACRHRVLDDGHGYEAVFVMRDDAIVTFYPDATPDESMPYCGE
ncbi:EndoU domain-containing protein [Roseospira goensis]|uniref:Bacterial EndoU nuclease domain-containing protein n=1 Tax=Roseospira goensis TaxID=391922 RepID=A0A7W6WKF4_9PROT|nr:EndoU domain-containing protein [Roseospira goensis]MBB4285392.1 hypothetical protein [Roseospira goensis]